MRIKSLFALAALAAGAAPAAAQTIIKDNSSPVVVSSITDYTTEFDKIGGMAVSWTLSGGGGSSALWGNIAGTSGIAGAWGVWSTNFKLWGSGSTDTFGDNVWNFWGNGISSFTMQALLGNSVFDVLNCSNAPCSTENSASGKEFNWSGSGPDSRVTYSNPIAVSPNTPVGDLYGTLKVEFGDYVAACPAGYSLHQGSCKKFIGYVCDAGWTLYNTDNCKKYYNNRWNYQDANRVYDYVTPTTTWVAASYGDSHCDGTKSPTVNQSGNGDNTRCYEKFSQDMDNLGLGGGTPQDVVPEPATMTLLATGLVGMAVAGRRRRKQQG